MFKKQNGITLVALVITIIVLLILAGVTISMVVGDNGIITRSKQSKYDSMTAEAVEKMDMIVAAAQMEIEQQSNYNGSYLMSTQEFNKIALENGVEVSTASPLVKDTPANPSTSPNLPEGSDTDGDGWLMTEYLDTNPNSSNESMFTQIRYVYYPADYQKTGKKGHAMLTFDIKQSDNGKLTVVHYENADNTYNSSASTTIPAFPTSTSTTTTTNP